MGAKNEFKVTIKRKEVVTPMLPLQDHWLPLSNLDLLLPPLDVNFFFCYKNNTSKATTTFASVVDILKKALAQTLVYYYAFSGEVLTTSIGEPEVCCNNRGVDFSEAFADIQLIDLDFYDADGSIDKFVPTRNQGVLSIQVTELKCGGVVVTGAFDHRISDAYSANLFLVSWAEMAQSKSISITPSFKRSLVNPRRPGHFDPSIEDMWVPVSSFQCPETTQANSDHLISRIYYVQADRLGELQKLASNAEYKRTKLESFTAYLWKLVANSAKEDNTKTAKLGIVIDGRTRLSEDTKEKKTQMETYFGNVLTVTFGEQNIKDIINKPLNVLANDVRSYIETGSSKDHFLDLIDWVEVQRPEPAMTKIYTSLPEEGPAFVMSSGQRFPVSKVDFGWGKPVFGSYHFPWGGCCGYVMPMPSPVVDGDWVVYLHLLKGQLDLIEKEGDDVLIPLTSDYLDL